MQLVLQLAGGILRFAVGFKRLWIIAGGRIFIAFLLVFRHLDDRLGQLGRLLGLRIPNASSGNRHGQQQYSNAHDPFFEVLRLFRKRLIGINGCSRIIVDRLLLFAEDNLFQRIHQAIGITGFR
ncbi:hypothetical protein D3C77_583140 [compost metagenome]